MRNVLIVIFAALLGGWGLSAYAQHDHSQHGTPADKVVKPETTTGVQKLCPVTGKPVKHGVSAKLDGRTVKFCCPNCIEPYRKDPDRYAPALYKQIYPQRVRVKCPVMGGEANPKVFVEHNGEKAEK